MLAGRGKGSGPQVQRIADPLLREVNFENAHSLEAVFQVFSTICSLVSFSSLKAVYNRRKNALFRRATEMSNMCDCEVAVIMFTPDGELAQFSTSSMEDMLRRYSRTCTDLHESQTREGMNKRAAATVEAKAANGGDGNAANNGGGPAKKRMKEESKSGGRGSARGYPADANDSDTAEAILSMQGLPPLAPAPEVPSQDMDLEFNKLIEERAKRAQQAAANNAGGESLARHPSGSASDRDAGAEAGPGPSAAFLAIAAAAAGAGTTAPSASAIDSLADLLKGSDPGALPPAVKSEPNESPDHAAPTAEDVDTPTVAPYPPVAGTVELPSMLGPVAGEQPAAE